LGGDIGSDRHFYAVVSDSPAFYVLSPNMIGKIFQFFVPKIFVLLMIVLAFWIGSVTLKEMNRGNRIQEEIAALHAEAQKTQKENSVLQEKIRYFQTDSFQAQEARNKLNYQSPNERAVLIKPIGNENDTKSSDTEVVSLKAQSFLPNYEKWWKQFFVL
jgi:cell division protein FtsB